MAYSKPTFPFIRSTRPSSFSVMSPHVFGAGVAVNVTNLNPGHLRRGYVQDDL